MRVVLVVAALLFVTACAQEPEGDWELYVCAFGSAMGCGTSTKRHFDTQEECLAVADTIKHTPGHPGESDNRRDILISCLPTR